FAGYTVAKERKGTAKGSVRDVDQEHWEQQIGAVNRAQASAGGPQTIAILAQGRGMSEFGKVPTYAYVRDILGDVPELAGIKQYDIILSAHSGGGSTALAPKVEAGQAKAVDAAKPPPHPTGMVVMFDAEGVESVTGQLVKQIGALAATLKTASVDEAKAAIAATPKFRGYFAKPGRYARRY